MTRSCFTVSEQAAQPVRASVCGPTTRCLWIALFLLLILIQMLTSLVAFAGVFVLSGQILISPFCDSSTRQHGLLSRDGFSFGRAEPEPHNSMLSTVTILGLNISVVLVAFALLSLLLAAYAKDRAALRLSAHCQATSCLFVATGIGVFLFLHRSYLSWGGMTLAFYLCVGLVPQLAATRVLTDESRCGLTSDWA